MYLEKINSPEDVKKLSISEMNNLSIEIRQALLKKLSEYGGHIGANLGMVELTIALHYVFNSPKDKIVYDVSHQSYVHKMLTGRKQAYLIPEKYKEVSGFTNPQESEHDIFYMGHTSTSISLACGLAKARDLQDKKDNIIAVIGDGSLSGGQAYEGLNNAAVIGTNMIIIVNDNHMSIAENHGGLYQNLKELRDTEGKNECNFFKAIGLDYYYVKDGHNLKQLINVLNRVKDIEHPVVVHVCTVKGKGLEFAEKNKEQWHSRMPFVLETGESKLPISNVENYVDLTATYLLDAMKKDPTIVAITSATPSVLGFGPERRKQAGKQFVDVGIAEEHAVALASGIAANGGKPVYLVCSTFLQRAYDQLAQDLCINNNPAVILVNAASVYGMKDVTHIGLFDIGMMSNIPNMVYLAPTCKEEYFAMLEWGINQQAHPVAIRVPVMEVISKGEEDKTDYFQLNKYKVTQIGKGIAVIALGDFYRLGEATVEKLSRENDIEATLINPRYITGIDKNLLQSLKENHQLVVTIEDGFLEGGFGEKISRYYSSSGIKVINYGIQKELLDRYVPSELMRKNRLTEDQIIEDILSIIKCDLSSRG